jgi:two-component sensor histidine kinase
MPQAPSLDPLETPADSAPQRSGHDLLMREVHHRVSNSLQLVSSMLQLQASQSGHPEVRQALIEAAGRIVAIASIHHRLHEREPTGQLDAVPYIADLVKALQGSLLDPAGGRSVALDMPVSLTLSGSVIERVGLIVSELVTNALKYGEGQVVLKVRRYPDGLELIAEDEGRGFPAEFVPAASNGFGMRLMAALAMNGPASVVIDHSVPFARIVVKAALTGVSDRDFA